MFPSVMFTVLSMVQALALALLWSRFIEASDDWSMSWESAAFALQILAALLGLLQIWLFYISIVIRLVWVPSIFDSAIPFGLGIVEFAMVELTQPGMLPGWLCAVALLAGSTFASGQWVFARARREPENEEFFKTISPATRRDLIPAPLVMLGLAILVMVLGEQPELAVFAVSAVIVIIARQTNSTRSFWNRTMREMDMGPTEEGSEA